jgi:hypothetical protein
MTKSIYRAYVFFLSYHLARLKDKNVGVYVDIHPCEDGKNTVVVVTFKKDEKNDHKIHDEKSLESSLVAAGIEHVFCPLEGMTFKGTTIYVGSDKIVFIKENKTEYFSEDAVRENLLTLVEYRLGKR